MRKYFFDDHDYGFVLANQIMAESSRARVYIYIYINMDV
jgi:hypothetical protein